MTPIQAHPSFQRGLDLILEAVAALQADARTVDADSYSAQLQRVARLRGRPLFFPYIGSGLGRGARVLTADGRWLLDFAIGIGVHFFGHSHPDLLRAALTAAASDVVMQGNLQANAEYVFELVEGESGFRVAPREFFVPLMETLKEQGVAVWVDEIQTFGRTGELFAFQRLGLTEYVDVVTVGKLLQNSAVLFRDEYQPDPSLISGTFAGSTVGLAVGRRIVEKLVHENYFGLQGKIASLEQHARDGLARLQADLPGAIHSFGGIGAMWAFEPAEASHEGVKALLQECYRNGLILYYAGVGDGPYRVRMFLPGGVLTVDEFDEALDILRFSISRLKQ